MGIGTRMRTLLQRNGLVAASSTPAADLSHAADSAPSIADQVETLASLGISLREPLTSGIIASAVTSACRQDLELLTEDDEHSDATPPVPGLQRSAFWWLLNERIDGQYAVGGRHRVLPPQADLFGDEAPDAEQLARSVRKVAQRLCTDTGARVPEVEVSDLRMRSQLLTTATVSLDGVPHTWSDVRDREFVRTLARACSTDARTIMVFDDHGIDTHWSRPMVDILVVGREHAAAVADLLDRHLRPAVAAAHVWIDLPYSGRDEPSLGRILEMWGPSPRRTARRTPWAPPALAGRAA